MTPLRAFWSSMRFPPRCHKSRLQGCRLRVIAVIVRPPPHRPLKRTRGLFRQPLLRPSLSSALVPCSSHSDRVTLEVDEHTSGRRRPRYTRECATPELLAVLHDIGQDRTAEEDHVFPPRRVFNPDLEVLQPVRFPAEDAAEVELLDPPSLSGRAGRGTWTSRRRGRCACTAPRAGPPPRPGPC